MPREPALWIKYGLGGTFLLAQVVAIGYARTVPARYFCWAPYDAITLFTLEATVDGHALSNEALRARYRYGRTGRDNRSPQHVIDRIQQYEQTYGRTDPAQVTLRYRTNGGKETTWTWPPQP